jgi:peptidoglycan/xylan/chitin deacetylase (PgdA/CDA1 family)
MNTKQLNVGFVGSSNILDEVVTEVLNHQGILFKEIRKATKADKKFPCVVLSRHEDSSYELARKHCEDEDGIVIAEKQLPLTTVLNALAGKVYGSLSDPMYPEINQYEIKLLNEIREKYRALNVPFVRKWFWPNFMKACCVLTHDVDWLYYSPWHFAVIRKKSILQLIKLAYQAVIHKRNYGNNIREIVSKEKARNVRSTFCFLKRARELTYYGVYQQEFLDMLRILRKEGFEIGLHGSSSSYRDLDILKIEKDKLERYADATVKGVRQHELNFLTPLTWEYQEKAGFGYDLTFSYNKRIGFRSGLCFPYHPIDLANSRKFSLLEIPTSFMDWTVLSRTYNELLGILEELEQAVNEFNGCLVMNFHNTYLNEETFPEMEKFYVHILDDLKEQSYWFATAEQCYAWWTKRENAKIDAIAKDGVIKGKTSYYPIPLAVEDADRKKKFVNLQGDEFTIGNID